jgi:hypothetical protein
MCDDDDDDDDDVVLTWLARTNLRVFLGGNFAKFQPEKYDFDL